MGLLPVRFLAHTLRCLGRLPPPFLFFRSVLVVGFRCVGSGADCKRPTGGWNTRMACLKDPPPPPPVLLKEQRASKLVVLTG